MAGKSASRELFAFLNDNPNCLKIEAAVSELLGISSDPQLGIQQFSQIQVMCVIRNLPFFLGNAASALPVINAVLHKKRKALPELWLCNSAPLLIGLFEAANRFTGLGYGLQRRKCFDLELERILNDAFTGSFFRDCFIGSSLEKDLSSAIKAYVDLAIMTRRSQDSSRCDVLTRIIQVLTSLGSGLDQADDQGANMGLDGVLARQLFFKWAGRRKTSELFTMANVIIAKT